MRNIIAEDGNNNINRTELKSYTFIYLTSKMIDTSNTHQHCKTIMIV